jgi:hypothetical protein
MKNSNSTREKRHTKRSPWSGKNMRLLRAALRVWELKRKAQGVW